MGTYVEEESDCVGARVFWLSALVDLPVLRVPIRDLLDISQGEVPQRNPRVHAVLDRESELVNHDLDRDLVHSRREEACVDLLTEERRHFQLIRVRVAAGLHITDARSHLARNLLCQHLGQFVPALLLLGQQR